MRSRTNALFASWAPTVFLALVLLQGFHELEHIVQVVQRYALGIPNGNGLVGSLADVEPVHLAYNTVYLALLVTVFVMLGLQRRGASTHGPLVVVLLTLAVGFQTWHELEHVVKLAQYLALHVNGTGGILGQGPGALAPLFPIPLLHLAYNTVAYLPALVAFALLMREIEIPAAAAVSRTSTLSGRPASSYRWPPGRTPISTAHAAAIMYYGL